jgi:hypothetical protein
MARKKRWEELDIIDGYGEVHLDSWRYFFDFVHQEMLDYETYIWRGERCDNWLLESTLDRLVKKAKIARTKRDAFRRSHLEQFKFAARGRRGPNPPQLENEDDWWALGQHFGLATPLLDWTTSPFVAAYFAYIEVGDKQTENRAIYALHRPSVEKKALKLIEIEVAERREKRKEYEASGKCQGPLASALLDGPIRPQMEFIKPFSDENQRLVNQGGLFTRAPDDSDIETWVKKNFKSNTRYTLMKIFVPNKDRETSLRALNRMNINHLTLFPDLYGASVFCNLFAEIKKY